MTELAALVRDSPAVQLVGALALALAGAWLLTRLLQAMFVHLSRRTEAAWDDQLASRLAGPFSTFVAVRAFWVGIAWVDLDPRAVEVLHSLTAVASVLVVEWGIFRAIDLVRFIVEQRAWSQERPATRSLLALAARFAKAAALILGGLVALSQLGVSVASLIAGLGIGGLVIALAAQKTVENVFGAVSIGIDQPLREGDFVRVYDFVGTVEQIGLRSTRIRTLDRTIVTIPNGELANQRIESFTARDRIRLACTIGLVYETTEPQLRAVVAELERILRAHPKIWPDAVVVRFKEFADSSLDVEVMAWFQTPDWSEFQVIRQDVLLSFMQAIQEVGTSIAFPTRTLHVVGNSQPDRLDSPRVGEEKASGQNDQEHSDEDRDKVHAASPQQGAFELGE